MVAVLKNLNVKLQLKLKKLNITVFVSYIISSVTNCNVKGRDNKAK